MAKYYLAIDIGASSGRHIVGCKEEGVLKTDEVFRFPNGVREEDGHLTWDIEALLGYVKEGIAAAKKKYPCIESTGNYPSRARTPEELMADIDEVI